MIHNRVEDANHEQPTSSKALFLVLLPDSQLCQAQQEWIHLLLSFILQSDLQFLCYEQLLTAWNKDGESE